MKIKKNVLGYEITSYFNRFLAFTVNTIFILSFITICLTYIYNLPMLIYIIPFYYLYTHNSLHRIIFTHAAYTYLTAFILTSFLYYFFESLFGISIGTILLNLRTPIIRTEKGLENKTTLRRITISIARALFLAVPFLVILDNILSKTGRKASDRLLGYIVVQKIIQIEKSNDLYEKILKFPFYIANVIKIRVISKHLPKNIIKKQGHFTVKLIRGPTVVNLLLVSLMLYVIPIVTILISGYINHTSIVVTPPPLISNRIPISAINGRAQMNIFRTNFGIDYKYFILGGFAPFLLLYLGLYSSQYISTLAIDSSLNSHYPYFIIFGVLPHFFVELIGYIFGILAGIYISKILFSLIENYFQDNPNLRNSLISDLRNCSIAILISFLTLLVASYIEIYVTSYFLNHFYFVS